jgi:phosphoglycolate phosphatase
VPSFYQAVLFDLDGTLLHTVPDIACAANRMLAELHQPSLAEEDIASFVGKGIQKLVERCLTRVGGGKAPGAQELNAALQIFEQCYAEESGKRSRPYPGAEAGLRRLSQAGIPMAVVTNKAARFTGTLLQQTGLAEFFTAVVSGDTLPFKKPDPRPVLHACERVGAEPAGALFIGDSRHDVAAARAAGCAIWCVPYGYNEGEAAESLACDRLVSDLDEASACVLRGER